MTDRIRTHARTRPFSTNGRLRCMLAALMTKHSNPRMTIGARCVKRSRSDESILTPEVIQVRLFSTPPPHLILHRTSNSRWTIQLIKFRESLEWTYYHPTIGSCIERYNGEYPHY